MRPAKSKDYRLKSVVFNDPCHNLSDWTKITTLNSDVYL